MSKVLLCNIGRYKIEFLLSEKLYRKLTGGQFITLHILCHYGKAIAGAISYVACWQVIITIIWYWLSLSVREVKPCWAKRWEVGGGILLPGSIIGGLMFADLPIDVWKAMIVSGLLVTSAMIWHKQLRHYVLLPSCVALISGLLVILMSLK